MNYWLNWVFNVIQTFNLEQYTAEEVSSSDVEIERHTSANKVGYLYDVKLRGLPFLTV